MNTYFSRVLIALGVSVLSMGHAASADETEEMPERVIVQVKGTDAGDIEGEVISSKQDRKQTTLTLEVPEGTSTAAFIKELKQEENVLRVEEDRLLTSTYTPNDFFYPYQSHHSNIRSGEAWERSKGANVTVAILDTGIDLSHEDLKDKIVNPYDVVYDSPYTLTAGEHGTHVAGIVASQMDNYYGGTGVAPDASIMPIDVFAGTSAYTSDVIEGVYRAVDQGADIINMSLGNYYYNYSFQQAINYAYANNVLVVAAAGNDSTSSTHYPSSYNYVISVGSTTSYDTLSYFSNYGWNIDVTAPGSSIYSTTPYSSYGYMSGTSMASPVVAGVAALVKSNEPGLSVDAITERLTSTADDLGSAGWDYYYGSGRVNAKEALQIRELEAVTLDEFSDASDTITGTVPSGNGYGSVVIYDGWGNEVGSVDYLSGGDTFSIPTPRYPAGTMMRALFYDYIGNHSPFAWFTVSDRTAPSQPTVLEMSDQLDYLVGQTEANAYVQVEQPNRGTVATGYADEYGSFMFYTGRLVAGTTLRVTATDASGNQSEATTLDVLDRTAPTAPQINELSDRSTTITGKAEAKATVIVKVGQTEKWRAVVGDAGTFSIAIARQVAGTALDVTVVDAAGNISPVTKLTVLDRTSPDRPSLNEVTDAATKMTGKAEKSAKVILTKNNQVLTHAFADDSGNFTLVLEKQPAGTVLTVVAEDAAGNTSLPVVTTVVDKTAPAKPSVNAVSDAADTVTGKAEAGSRITVISGTTLLGQTTVKADGTYAVTIEKQTAGTRLSVTSTDAAGNISPVTETTVVDKTAPAKPSVSAVSDAADTVTGKAEASSVVAVKVGTVLLGQATTGVDGTFSVAIAKQKAGTVLTVTSTDAAGNVSPSLETTVLDKTAPAKPSVNAVSDAADTVTGKAEADSKVIVKSGTTVLGQATAKADGTYAVTVTKQKAGTRLSVTSTDAAGNVSPAIETTVVDKTAPAKPSVDPVSDLSTAVTGKAEPGSTISVQLGTTLLGQAVTKEDGTYAITIEKQPVGTVLRLTSKDVAGNVSPVHETTVVDKTAPAKPSVNAVSDATDTLGGKAEAGSIVTVKAGAVLVGQVTTKADGTYVMTMGKQKAGTRLSVTSTDAAGNVSPVVETTVIDKTSPIAPTVSEVTDQTVELNGTAEAGTILTVKVGSNELVKSTVGTDGTFRLAIPKQAVATRLSITSTDAAGNVSPVVTVIVLDRTAPAIPHVDEVNDRTVIITGTAEAQAVVHVKQGTVEIGKAIVQADGTFRVSISKQPANAVLHVTVVDGAGNVSQSVSVLVADKSAPVFQVNQITNQTVTIQGTTEARAVVEMTYAQQSTRVTADANGRFSFAIKAPKTGERFSFIATDAAGNQSETLNLTVTDMTKPLLSGVSAFTLEAGRSFDPKQGVAAIDETDGDVTSSILISGLVDVKKPGVYPVTYVVKDRAGNESKVVRQITVKDTVKPTLSGIKSKTVYWNTSFDARKGVTAKDDISGDLTKVIKVSGKVDVKKVGTYAVTYSVSDQSGNTTTAVRKVVVKDHIKPVISGAKSKTVKLKSSFKPLAGVSAKDTVDGTLTKLIKVTGKVDTKRKGVYPLTYTVKDKAGNSAVVKVKITVK